MNAKVSEKEKQLLLMKSIEFFRSFTDKDINALLSHSYIMKYNSGRYIIREDTHGDSFYVILRGSVEVLKEDNKVGTRKLATLPHGVCFGEMAVLLKEPRTASIKAEEDTYIFEIRLEEIQNIDPDVSEKLFRQFAVTLAKRLQDMNNQKVNESG